MVGVTVLAVPYPYALAQGLIDTSARPMGEAIGSSPPVLMFLFTSKDELAHAPLVRVWRSLSWNGS